MKFNRSYKIINKIAALMVSSSALLLLTTASVQADDASDIEKARTEISKIIPVASTANITKTPAKNVYEIEVGGNYVYVYVDGDFVMVGDLYDSEKLVNLGEEKTNKVISDAVNEFPTSKMIVYGPDKPKRYITVFTDIDCGYCRKLHNEIPELIEAGVQVRYLAFPRAGIGSNSHKKYVSVWCNDDSQASLTTAKSGGSVAEATCENPVSETYNLGQKIGVRGTPMIIFDDGEISPGYLPSAELLRRLGING